MRSFLEWLDADGFYIKSDWDEEEGTWISHSKLKLEQWQRDIMEYLFTIDPETGTYPYRTILLSMIKKSGKTTIGAAIGAWYAECGPDNSEIYVIANDVKQAQQRMFEDIKYHAIQRREEPGGKEIWGALLSEELRLHNGTYIQVLAREYTSAAGSRQGLTLWDELWGYTSERSRRMWEEMTLPPTVQHPMKVVVTYAGYKGESKLLWEMYQRLVLNGEPIEEFKRLVNRKGKPIITHVGRQFALWDDQPRMVWQTKEYYREEKDSLRPMKFLQLHRNEWVTSEESFIPENFFTRAVVLDRPLLYDPDSEFRKHPISIGVDIGIKHDDAAIVGTYYDPKVGKVKQAFHYIWKTDPEYPLDIEHTVEAKLLEMNGLFNIVAVLYDPYQFHRSATTLKTKGLPMIEYAQSESNMTAASQNLYDLYKTQRIEHYAADDMEEHVTLAAAKNKGRGFRLVKDDESGAPNDAAIALAMSAFDAVNRMGVDTSIKVVWESPFSDFTGLPEKSSRHQAEEGLPFALRSN